MDENIFGMLHKKFTPPGDGSALSNGYRDGNGRRGACLNKKGSIVMNLRPVTGAVMRGHARPNLREKDQERRSDYNHERLQFCTVCDGEIRWNYPESQSITEWKAKVKKFYSRQFVLADFMDVTRESCNFPFCFACAKQLEKLMTMEREYELMISKFQHVKEAIASRSAKSYLRRVESESLFCEKGRELSKRNSVSPDSANSTSSRSFLF